jgi:hypothetical protein
MNINSDSPSMWHCACLLGTSTLIRFRHYRQTPSGHWLILKPCQLKLSNATVYIIQSMKFSGTYSIAVWPACRHLCLNTTRIWPPWYWRWIASPTSHQMPLSSLHHCFQCLLKFMYDVSQISIRTNFVWAFVSNNDIVDTQYYICFYLMRLVTKILLQTSWL